jgi:hypothetical protein
MTDFIASVLFWIARGGAIIVAAVLLALATPKWCHQVVRILLCAGAVLLLSLQGGCWYMLEKISEPTSGGPAAHFSGVLVAGMCLVVAYSIVLIFWRRNGS